MIQKLRGREVIQLKLCQNRTSWEGGKRRTQASRPQVPERTPAGFMTRYSKSSMSQRGVEFAAYPFPTCSIPVALEFAAYPFPNFV